METFDAAAALFLLLVGPALAADLLRRVRRGLRRGVARLCGRMRPFTGRARIVDGDTLVVAGCRVRLFGIDAPETSQPEGDLARAHLVRLVGGAEVRVTPLDTDRHGRTVAAVHCDGRDLARAMAADGFARATGFWSWAYVPAELGARWRRRGLWAKSRFSGIRGRARRRHAAAWRSIR
jgi:endonuclease YncB( thermonuclease family)